MKIETINFRKDSDMTTATADETETLDRIRRAELTVQKKEKVYVHAREAAKEAKENYEAAISDLRESVREIDEPSLPLGKPTGSGS